jgi:hypothetical protein
VTEKIIKPSQNGRAKDRVIAKCLVEVKEYARSPSKLVWAIMKNKEIKSKILILLVFNRTENSEIKVLAVVLRAIKNGDCRAQ